MDIVQILIFIGVIFFITGKKYKEISSNRPQQNTPHEDDSDDMDKEMPETAPRTADDEESSPWMTQNDDEELKFPPYVWAKIDKEMDGEELPPWIKPDDEELKLPPYMWARIDYERRNKKADKKTEQHKEVEQAEKKEEKKQAEKVQDTPNTRKIRFNTPLDARRAFIYSEIFNRKY